MYTLTSLKLLLIPPILCNCVILCWGKKSQAVFQNMPGWVAMPVSFDLYYLLALKNSVVLTFCINGLTPTEKHSTTRNVKMPNTGSLVLIKIQPDLHWSIS